MLSWHGIGHFENFKTCTNTIAIQAKNLILTKTSKKQHNRLAIQSGKQICLTTKYCTKLFSELVLILIKKLFFVLKFPPCWFSSLTGHRSINKFTHHFKFNNLNGSIPNHRSNYLNLDTNWCVQEIVRANSYQTLNYTN